MAITISYMVHGTTQDNIDNLFSGQHDIELSNPRGIVEAKHLGETIKHKFDIIFVTGLKRSIQTAKLAFPHRCEIVEETLLKECDYGDLNQTSKEGIYAIGDVCSYPGKLKLILTGFSEAAIAAHSCFKRVFPEKVLHFEYSTTSGVKKF